MTESIQKSPLDECRGLVQMGFTHHQAGRFDLAQSHYEAVLEKDPCQLDGLQLLGVLLAQQGNPLAAIPYFERAIALQQQPSLHANCARAYFDLGDWLKALDHYGVVIELQPEAVDAHFGYAECQLHLERFDEAINAYQKVLDLRSDHHEALAALANACRHKKDFEKALIFLNQAIELAPNLTAYLVNQALLLGDLGRDEEALASLNAALAVDSGCIDALINQFALLVKGRRLDEALFLFQESLKTEPQHLKALTSEVLTLQSLGFINDDESLFLLESLMKVSVEPPPETLNVLGTLCLKKGKLIEALAHFDRALRLDTRYVDGHCNRGTALNGLNRFQEALESFNRAISFSPQMAEAHSNRVFSLMRLDRDHEALESSQKAVLLGPSLAEAHLSRGLACAKLRRFDEAFSALDKAISIRPDLADAYASRGGIYWGLGRLEEAYRDLQRAIEFHPDSAVAHNNLGLLLKERLQIDDAIAAFDKAISLNPCSADAHFNLALIFLLKGDLAEGFKGYEWRWKGPMLPKVRELGRPLWLGGESLAGKTLLVTVEQGFGDFLQYARYFPLLAAEASSVTVEVPEALLELIETLECGCHWVKSGSVIPDTDYWCPLMSLPLALKTELQTIPSQPSYLRIPSYHQILWAKKMGDRTRSRIGLVWSGSASHSNDLKRSIPLEILSVIFDHRYEFHVLQKELRADDQLLLASMPEVQIHANEIRDFADTAGVIGQMDLVITVDTSVAHLAGALGRPTWILIPYCPDFRWLLDRSDSPWYPSVRLFRQESPGDWAGVLEKVRIALNHSLMMGS